MGMESIKAIRYDILLQEYRVGQKGVTSIEVGHKGWYPGCYVVYKEDKFVAVCPSEFWKVVA